jgi:predicted RNase H-like nuclease (RuvC/YqgF family)
MEQDETGGRGRFKAVALVMLVVFLVGMFLGYYIWGYRRQKSPDYKEMLQQTISYIGAIEEKNKELTARVGSLETEAESLKKRLDQPQGSGGSDLGRRIEALEKENAELRPIASERDGLLKENQQLRQRVQSLVEELNASERDRPGPQKPPAPGTSGY